MGSLLTEDIQPSRVGRTLLGRWLFIVVLAVMGGLVGLGTSYLLPAEYLATASLGIGPDPNLAAPLSGSVQTEAYLRVQDLLLSDSTLGAARASVAPNLAGQTLAGFRAYLSLDRVGTRWDLKATGASPGDAAARANAWQAAASSQFAQAQAHALQVGQLQGLLFRVACQPEAVAAQGLNDVWSCGKPDLAINTNQISQQLLEEVRLSQGILPALSMTDLHAAAPEGSIELRSRPLFILAGTLVGLLLGVTLVLAGVPAARVSAVAEGEPEGEAPQRRV